MKLLIVEDNEHLVERVKRQLGRQFLIDAVSSGADALEKVKSIDYTVIVLDLGLPDMSGLEVCRQIRYKKIETPVLIVTGVDTVESRVDLLNAGADDYIAKPFHSDELHARIAALARRCPIRKSPEPTKHLGLIIDSEKRQVHIGGRPIELRRKEFDILEYLIANRGRIVTRAMIIDHAWDANNIVSESVVDVHIKHVRDKLERPSKKRFIKTIYGTGYTVDLPEY